MRRHALVVEPVVAELVETTVGLFLTADTSTGSVSASAALVGSVVLEPVEAHQNDHRKGLMKMVVSTGSTTEYAKACSGR